VYLHKTIAFLAIAAICFFSAQATVTVKPPFANSMVLQRNMVNPIWGTASSGEQVTITLGTQTQTVQTPTSGKWAVKLDPMTEAGPLTMTIKGTNTVTLTDVYIGEVWQVAGQSNMDTRLSFYANLADSIKNADIPLLRYYTLRQPGQTTTWLVVSPSTAPQLSAVGYFFGKEIQKTVGVAVGLVVTAVGGTTVESWLDPATLSANPGITNADKGGMWNSWVAPVVGYGIKGTVWIQGEQNANPTGSATYGDRFKLVIKGWRAAWGQGDFPFYYGQLSGTSGSPDPNAVSYVATVREGQRLALALPNTAMTVQFDYAAGNWHFLNKPEAGRRLSLPAKALLYGQTTLEYSGPAYVSKIADGSKIKLLFGHVGGGLVAQGGKLSGFAIAAEAGDWVWGDAAISGDTVIVSSASIVKPTRVRYAWSDRPQASLFNKEGLPASSFTTESQDLPVQVAEKFTIKRMMTMTGGDARANLTLVNTLGRRQMVTRQIMGTQMLWNASSKNGLFVMDAQSEKRIKNSK
jgi:sialate O-acetylesterase